MRDEVFEMRSRQAREMANEIAGAPVVLLPALANSDAFGGKTIERIGVGSDLNQRPDFRAAIEEAI